MKTFWQDLRSVPRSILKQSAFTATVTLALGSGANTMTPLAPWQDHQSASTCQLETKYDRVADMTTVQCGELIKWGEAPAKLTVQANVSFHGKESNETARFWFSLSSNRGGSTRHTQPLFQEAQTLYLLLDSTQLEVPVRDYHSEFFELIRSFAESARAEISREDLQKLLDARRLAGKWGDVEFRFSDAALVSLKNFIAREALAASTH